MKLKAFIPLLSVLFCCSCGESLNDPSLSIIYSSGIHSLYFDAKFTHNDLKYQVKEEQKISYDSLFTFSKGDNTSCLLTGYLDVDSKKLSNVSLYTLFIPASYFYYNESFLYDGSYSIFESYDMKYFCEELKSLKKENLTYKKTLVDGEKIYGNIYYNESIQLGRFKYDPTYDASITFESFLSSLTGSLYFDLGDTNL